MNYPFHQGNTLYDSLRKAHLIGEQSLSSNQAEALGVALGFWEESRKSLKAGGEYWLERLKGLSREELDALGEDMAEKIKEAKKQDEEAERLAEEDYVKELRAKEKELRAVESVFEDVEGIPLSRLCAGRHPLKKFWEEFWNEEDRDFTRAILAKNGLQVRKVKEPLVQAKGSISKYEIVARKKPRYESFLALEPLPSGKEWSEMDGEEREEFVKENAALCRAAGISAKKIKGISERHIYEAFDCSRSQSKSAAWKFEANGVFPAELKAKTETLELLGLEDAEELAALPLNMVKGVIAAIADGAVSSYWASRGEGVATFQDRFEEYEFYKSLWRGEFDALEVSYGIKFSERRMAEFREVEAKLEQEIEKFQKKEL